MWDNLILEHFWINAPERGLKIQLVFVLVIYTETFANEFA